VGLPLLNIMTAEEAKKYLPFIIALADGKQLQWYSIQADLWHDTDHPTFCMDYGAGIEYRIKPEDEI